MNNNNEAEKNAVELLSEAFLKINIDCPAELAAKWAQSTMASEDEIGRMGALLSMIRSEMDKHRMLMLTTMSRIPQVARKTFDIFHTDRLSKENEEMIKHLKSLDFITLGENIVIAGDPGTGHWKPMLREDDTCEVFQIQRACGKAKQGLIKSWHGEGTGFTLINAMPDNR